MKTKKAPKVKEQTIWIVDGPKDWIDTRMFETGNEREPKIAFFSEEEARNHVKELQNNNKNYYYIKSIKLRSVIGK